MSYNEFKSEYAKLINLMVSYDSHQVGKRDYAEKLGALVDSVPAEWEEMADADLGFDV